MSIKTYFRTRISWQLLVDNCQESKNTNKINTANGKRW